MYSLYSIVLSNLLLKIQDVVATSSYDAAGSFLLLGGSNGSIYYVGTFRFLKPFFGTFT